MLTQYNSTETETEHQNDHGGIVVVVIVTAIEIDENYEKYDIITTVSILGQGKVQHVFVRISLIDAQEVEIVDGLTYQKAIIIVLDHQEL